MCVCVWYSSFQSRKANERTGPRAKNTFTPYRRHAQSILFFSCLVPLFLFAEQNKKKKREEKFHCVNIQENVDTSLTRAVGLYGMLPHVHPRVADGEVQRRVERESTSGGEKRQQRREKRTVLEGAALLICVYTIIEAYLPTRSPHASTVHISRRESVFLQLGSQTIGNNNNNTQ